MSENNHRYICGECGGTDGNHYHDCSYDGTNGNYSRSAGKFLNLSFGVIGGVFLTLLLGGPVLEAGGSGLLFIMLICMIVAVTKFLSKR